MASTPLARRVSGRLFGAILLALLAQAGIRAIDVQLSDEDIRRATELARFPHTNAERATFHGRYTVLVSRPMVEYFTVQKIEVITEFRRLELIAEDHARMNDLFARGGLSDAKEALRPWRDRVSVVAHLQFDQMKVIPGVPDADIVLAGSPFVLPIDISRTPIYIPSGDLTLLVGGVIEAVFDVRALGQAARPVLVSWNGKELVRVAFDFPAVE